MTGESFRNICAACGRAAYRLEMEGKSVSIGDMIPGGMCLFAFHAAYAYALTHANDGWFNWVRNGDGVIVHCPCEEGIVMKIAAPAPDGTVAAEVVDPGPDCPMRYASGRMFALSFDADHRRSMAALDKGFALIAGTIAQACATTQVLCWRHGETDVRCEIEAGK